ncbi:hypothetical protein SY88_09505 [Clostridiales bacterium PH28_bin88]|nr:hypothetical protein SY88_09505 [Clostridiales bacterium PH28_bin88]
MGWDLDDRRQSGGVASMLATGVVTAFNPCMLAMAPAAAGYVGGNAGSGRQGLVLSLMCVLGYAGMLSLLGLMAGALGLALVPAGTWSPVLGLVYIALGGYLLLGRHRRKLIPWRLAGFYYSPSLHRLEVSMGRGTVLGALALGAAFSLIPSPCATPVVLAVLGTVAATGGLLKGMLLLFAFGVGHSSLLFIFGGFLIRPAGEHIH